MSEDWFLVMKIPVKPLSPDPDIPGHTLVYDLNGSFCIRVAARNISGLGASTELIVDLQGNLTT